MTVIEKIIVLSLNRELGHRANSRGRKCCMNAAQWGILGSLCISHLTCKLVTFTLNLQSRAYRRREIVDVYPVCDFVPCQVAQSVQSLTQLLYSLQVRALFVENLQLPVTCLTALICIMMHSGEKLPLFPVRMNTYYVVVMHSWDGGFNVTAHSSFSKQRHSTPLFEAKGSEL